MFSPEQPSNKSFSCKGCKRFASSLLFFSPNHFHFSVFFSLVAPSNAEKSIEMERILNSYWVTLNHQYSPQTIYVVGTLLLHHIIFWTLTLPLLYLDLKQKPAFLHAYKIQPKTNITVVEAKKCIKNVLINQSFVMIPFNVLLYYLIVAHGGLKINAPLPAWYVGYFKKG